MTQTFDGPVVPVNDSERSEVIRRELEWHETEARRRYSLDRILYDAPAFDDVVRPALAFLQPLAGELLLDLGGGEGKETCTFAHYGARVVNTDLSFVQLQRARRRSNQAKPSGEAYFVQANAEELPFAGGAFKRVYGKAILHHLDLGAVSDEVRRVLHPSGLAAFAEPLHGHPLFWLGRKLTPKLRTLDERPLKLSEIMTFAHPFALQALATTFLLAPLAYPLRLIPRGETIFRVCHSILRRIDKSLLARLPGMRRWAWYATIHLKQRFEG